MNKYHNAIEVLKQDLERKAQALANSLASLDRTPEREQEEGRLLAQVWEDRRAITALVTNGAPKPTA